MKGADGKDLTVREAKALQFLHKASQGWPASLWLYSGGEGDLNVMRCKPDGTPAMTPSGGVDPDYIVRTIPIPSDGGGW